jgi:flagellar basal-body rod protein FlgC
MMHAIHIAASGMRVQQTRMTAIAENIANVNTLEGPDGEPYRRQVTHVQSLPGGGVRARLAEDPEPYRQEFDPDHPRADEAGYVTVPDIDVPQELADMKIASRAYRANAMVMKTADKCFDTLLRIFDKPRWRCDRHRCGC